MREKRIPFQALILTLTLQNPTSNLQTATSEASGGLLLLTSVITGIRGCSNYSFFKKNFKMKTVNGKIRLRD